MSKHGVATICLSAAVVALTSALVVSQNGQEPNNRPTALDRPPPRRAEIEATQTKRSQLENPSMMQQTQAEHTNRLINATSPYLLQHAHNPVDWHEWGEEALAKAKREDKPIFLSIGYAACHWCHVMEHESFENEAIAAIMNEHFVCIKVDREQRPDLDDIYMKATQAMTGSGGWPMSVWLTPDLKPFYAGTYFPPESRYGRPGFPDVLLYLAQVWTNEREKVFQQADALTEAVKQASASTPSGAIPEHTRVVQAAEQLARAFDPVKGGISGGGTNKFPPSMAMDLMLRAYHHSISDADGVAGEKKELLQLVELTLEKMAHGGIYDHLAGGIARYSTDVDWLVPHFEKMLYDQALVSGIYLTAYQATGKTLYADTARGILDYVMADLQCPDGGYYSTRDADSEGEEGKFYVWSRQEVESILGEADAALFCDYYDVSEAGNWEGKNILNVPRPLDVVAQDHGLSADELWKRLEVARLKVLSVRDKRIKPGLDDKVLASWNGLMIASMARASRILQDERYAESASMAAEFVLAKMVRDGRLLRTYRGGKAEIGGYLDDYAFMIDGLITLYETTFDPRWLKEAERLNALVAEHFRDDANGAYFFTADDAEKLIVRSKDAGDGAIPSGNSVQVMNLLRLSVLLGREDLGKEAERCLAAFGQQMNEMPYRSERLLAALDFYHRRPREVAIVAGGDDRRGFDSLVAAAWSIYVPNMIIAAIPPGADVAVAKEIPLLSGRSPIEGKPAAYVCRDFTCRNPTSDPAELKGQLGG